MAFTVLLWGVGGRIGLVAFQKNMEFGRDFRFFFFQANRRFCRDHGCHRNILRSYLWAMVMGALAGRGVGVVFSYWMHDYRPRFSFKKVRELWSFSQWILVRNIGSYGLAQLDKFLVGHRTDAATVGTYSFSLMRFPQCRRPNCWHRWGGFCFRYWFKVSSTTLNN